MKSLVQIIALAVGFGALLSVMHGNAPAAAAQQKQAGELKFGIPKYVDLETGETFTADELKPVGDNQLRRHAIALTVIPGTQQVVSMSLWRDSNPYGDPRDDKVTMSLFDLGHRADVPWIDRLVVEGQTIFEWGSLSECDNAPQFKECNDGNGKP